MTLLWSPSHPMADAVPAAPVKASVLTLKAQRYAGAGPGAPVGAGPGLAAVGSGA